MVESTGDSSATLEGSVITNGPDASISIEIGTDGTASLKTFRRNLIVLASLVEVPA